MTTVLKFGGSSVATVEQIQAIASYLKGRADAGEKLVVVVSAMGKMTDSLIAQARTITDRPERRELDRLLAIGEEQTISLLSIALNSLGTKALSLTGAQAGISTMGLHTKSKIKQINGELLREKLVVNDVIIVAGFQGVNEHGDVTTLGRGGSDTTAVALAAVLDKRCEIYTDVDGVYTADPRVHKTAKAIDRISYDEMMEMSALGSKVMEMRSVELGKKYGVHIFVGKTLDSQKGTWIMEATETMEQKVVSSVSVTKNVLSVSIKHVPQTDSAVADIFELLSNRHVNIDMISQTTFDGDVFLSFTCPLDEEEFLEEALGDIMNRFTTVKVDRHDQHAKLSVVGIGMRDATGVASRLFAIFRAEAIPFYQVTTSEISISYTIAQSDVERTVAAIAHAFEL
ncbi:aspartate kinase [Exiguobacterium flavidum]|uniref:aspartate kinase n=1 Tax=Exiguobacterium flavidum TaxID=2184695 RepID=UPI000DF7A362|nr:aspartate kinase [Exiguobacterium flavidum]